MSARELDERRRVCRDSALYGYETAASGLLNQGPKPYVPWTDTTNVYVHTTSKGGWGTAGILGGNSGDPNQNPELFNPPPGINTLFSWIEATINAH